jgi:UDP-2,4-diacetamido-2,4,6-trideoxy-beta-L-altropyranose hydrolase/UDP-4-amino-4,6-dideoxy-N-acetyl-beta-L-altrosamine N-acetyltransferase
MAKVIIRADSSSMMGTGHIMRDLVLAKQFDDVLFAVLELEGNINHKITAAGFAFAVLADSSAETLAKLIKEQGAETLVIDHYGIDYTYEKRIKELTGVKIFCLDDTYEKHFCDVLLNHNIYADGARYKGLVPDGCELRCGAEYTLLRDEFIEEKAKGRAPDRYSVFIAMGGADTAGLNIKILDVLRRFPHIRAKVVTTSANAGLSALKAAISSYNAELFVDCGKIAEVMGGCGLAIITPSVTMGEALCLGMDIIAVKTADNQNEMFRYAKANGITALEEFDADRLFSSVCGYFSEDCVGLTDFTALTERESADVLRWRNDDSVRFNMYNTHTISVDEHKGFIESLKTRTDKQCFVVRRGADAVGVINFSGISPESVVMGIYAVPDVKGAGKTLMGAIKAYAFDTLKSGKIISEVFADNEKAHRLYERFGFAAVGERTVNDRKVIVMELKNENRQS